MSTAILPMPIPAVPVSAAPISIVTDDELYEVIDGQRVRTPPRAVNSVWIASEIHSRLSYFARTQKLSRAISEALFHLPAPINRDRRPDVAFVSYDRWPTAKPIPTDAAWNVVPNLATEVVSPADKVDEVEQKILEYFRAGVELVWLVHPTLNKIHVYSSPTQPIVVLNEDDTLDGGLVVPGFRLPLAELFTEAADASAVNGAG